MNTQTGIVHVADARNLSMLPDESVHCVVCSPPYMNLRAYQAGDGEIGRETTVREYVDALVTVFCEIRRVLRGDGVVWINLGDSYGRGTRVLNPNDAKRDATGFQQRTSQTGNYGDAQAVLPQKQLMGVPWRVALALQDDGWFLRADCVWHKCLTGTTYVYAKTQKGEMPMMIKDLARLSPSTVQLWNGKRWTQMVAIRRVQSAFDAETRRKEAQARRYARSRGDNDFVINGDLEIELRSGEKIGCTRDHRFPTTKGLMSAEQLRVGDIIETCTLPEPELPMTPQMLDDEMIGWFLGTYLADGNINNGTAIEVASHAQKWRRFDYLDEIAKCYDANACHYNTKQNTVMTRIHSRILTGIVNTYIAGSTSHDKRLTTKSWQRSNKFLSALLQGYLQGDGHYDEKNDRYRIGFTDNDYWARDLRTICSRLGIYLRLHRAVHKMNGREFKGWRGELRYAKSDHPNTKHDSEVVAIRACKSSHFYDIAVADDPHLFALASGVLTHNCNSMPSSVADRVTINHEYVFMLTKEPHYWYDFVAVLEPLKEVSIKRQMRGRGTTKYTSGDYGQAAHTLAQPKKHRGGYDDMDALLQAGELGLHPGGRNKRSVWTVATSPSAYDFCANCGSLFIGAERKPLRHVVTDEQGNEHTEMLPCPHCGVMGWFAHFAPYPRKLIEPAILAACPPHVCADCGMPYVRVTEKKSRRESGSQTRVSRLATKHDQATGRANGNHAYADPLHEKAVREITTMGWRKACSCACTETLPGIVLDPFMGSGTTAMTAEVNRRRWIGIDLNPNCERLTLARLNRINDDP